MVIVYTDCLRYKKICVDKKSDWCYIDINRQIVGLRKEGVSGACCKRSRRTKE